MHDSFPWLSSYEEGVPASLPYPDAAVTRFLTEAAAQHPGLPAIRYFGATLRYAELLECAYRFAQVLVNNGVRPGDRVALMLPNIPQYVISYYGTLFAGAVVVQTNPLYVERELAEHLADAGAVAIVCLDLCLERVCQVRPETRLRAVFATGIRDYLPPLKKLLYPLAARRSAGLKPVRGKPDAAISFVRALAGAPPGKPDLPEPEPGNIAVLQYTGGTTGTPKGVMLTHRNLVANVLQCGAWMRRCKPAREKILTAVPLFHVYGMTVCMNYAISMAATLVLIPRFDPEQLLKQIDRERPTLFPGAPTMYIGLLHHPRLLRFDLSSIQCCISGSSALPMRVKLAFEKQISGRLVEGYGLSETSPVTHVNPIWGRNKAGSIGLPWPDTEARILDPAGEEALGPNQIGELAVKGPQVMKGYWNRPDETAAVLQDGWLRTGDLAYCDEDGYFYVVDRKKDMINASGLKVYPREVEEVLYSHAAVREAAVVGVADDYRGETVKAFVVLQDDDAVTAEQLTRYCREKLAPYKVPRLIEFRKDLPKTFVGKTLRRALAEEERKKHDTNEQDGNRS